MLQNDNTYDVFFVIGIVLNLYRLSGVFVLCVRLSQSLELLFREQIIHQLNNLLTIFFSYFFFPKSSFYII